ncbi:hypothetical protein ACHAW5_009700 [Stephanodiscus triporus]|uniref:SET domain-containing protein n=1 Tax=Stephanodiscus triporus TaxID=2934178 RepID=A0ABD3MV34_9STRA
MIAAILAVVVLAVSAFGWSDHSSLLAQKSRIHHSNHGISSSRHQNVLRSSSLSEAQDVRQDHQQQQHPHSKLWSTTLENSKCYVNPSIELAVRPPSEGGTGIVAVVDIPADTVVMCLPLEEVGMVDAASILDLYNEEEGRDEVLTLLKDMWNRKELATSEGNSEDGKRLAIFAGIIAHLQLTRYKDMKSNTSGEGVSSYALNQSRRLALFLDAMPLLPQRDDNINSRTHPFPTHYLYWTDDEIQILLRGTIGQTKAREVRAGIGLVVREWSSSFLEEHFNNGDITQTQILNAIFSAFTAVLSRSFGDSAGRDLNGKGRMLVPLVDMLNHDGEDPNVRWTWHVGGDDENGIEDGKGDIVVTTLSEVKTGKELFKCYGWRPSWDVASSYGFVPRLSSQRWECSAIPLFPAELDLAPDSIATPNQKANHETTLDLSLESNYAPLLKSIVDAVETVNEFKDRQAIDYAIAKNETTNKKNIDRPKQLDRLQLVSLFQPPPKSTAKKYPFLRRQPCVVIGTKIQISLSDENDHYHCDAINSVLPAFRAAASAISQLRNNHQRFGNANTSQIVASQMTMAAGDSDWDVPARQLIMEGISDRIQNLVDDGTNAKAWLAKQNDATGMTDRNGEHGRFRADMASDVREAELKVLRVLLKELLNGKR